MRAEGWRWGCTTAPRSIGRASFAYRLQRDYPVYLVTKNTVLKAYGGTFKDIFQAVHKREFEAEPERRGLTYEHGLIDDMVASALKWEGDYVGACENYDGDVDQPDRVDLRVDRRREDVARLIGPDQEWLTTEPFRAVLDENLSKPVG